jgi:hypothetical protein
VSFLKVSVLQPVQRRRPRLSFVRGQRPTMIDLRPWLPETARRRRRSLLG